MKVAILGAGAGGFSAAAELGARGHEIYLWNRSPQTISEVAASGVIGYDGVFGTGEIRPALITADISKIVGICDVALITLPTLLHGQVAEQLAKAGWGAQRPVILNPGHTGGALEFLACYRAHAPAPPIAEFSTLTYVARKSSASRVMISGTAKKVRVACLPDGAKAMEAAKALYPSADPVADVLATSLSNVNMVLHAPGAVLGSVWVEATGGDFTFYVQGMTDGVARVMKALDNERRAVAKAFGHDLPNLIEEMQRIGTVEPEVTDTNDFKSTISSGKANSRIKAPDSFAHRYYQEDLGYGLMPFRAFARIAGIEVPTADALLSLGAAAMGQSLEGKGRSAKAMGIDGLDRASLNRYVRSA
jgi:opine dehydrogenase